MKHIILHLFRKSNEEELSKWMTNPLLIFRRNQLYFNDSHIMDKEVAF